ncbi:hypothetical protein KEM52_006379 [Ascosphaera acerosa]|nr:hypothetical protein KEM52_006379 [Ascosphaera acerosa]
MADEGAATAPHVHKLLPTLGEAELPRLPTGAPALLVDNTVTVTDPHDILVYHQLARRREFYDTVARYQAQLRHGCASPHCICPTCLAYRQRASMSPGQPPLRKPTQLSARIISHVLASEDGPLDGLCRCGASREGGASAAADQTRRRESHAESQSPSPDSRRGASHTRARPQLDPKSFAQCLFDTDAVRLAEWRATLTGATSGHEGAASSRAAQYRDGALANADVRARMDIDPSQPRSATTTTEHAQPATDGPCPAVRTAQRKVGFTREQAEAAHAGPPTRHTGSDDDESSRQAVSPQRARHAAQTLARLSPDIIAALAQVHRAAKRQEHTAPTAARQGQEDVRRLAAQSVWFTLSCPARLLRSFRFPAAAMTGSASLRGTTSSKDPRRQCLDVQQIQHAFTTLEQLCPWETTLHSLWTCLERLFAPPPSLSILVQPQHDHGSKGPDTAPGTSPRVARQRYLNAVDATHTLVTALLALASPLTDTDAESWPLIRDLLSEGRWAPPDRLKTWNTRQTAALMDIVDRLQNEMAVRLARRIARAVAARVAFREVAKCAQQPRRKQRRGTDVVAGIVEQIVRCATCAEQSPLHAVREPQVSIAATVVMWLKAIVLSDWNGAPEINRATAVGGAVYLLEAFYKARSSLSLQPDEFYIPFLAQRLDAMDVPSHFLARSSNNQAFHLLEHPYLFRPEALVRYYRAMNYSVMSKYYEEALAIERHAKNIAASSTIDVYSRFPGLVRRMQTATLSFLLIVARRDNLVTDALDQLWRREKRELLRPLKVIMGMHEGEEGVDHGGVQQEFFRAVLAEILDADYGMFTIDQTSYSAWFQPGSLEPLYKFELLGLLVSLAIYNGLTLPVNFPLALYMKLLDRKPTTIADIRDGWPELARGLDELLRWSDGDVGAVFVRTYEFSFEAFGSVVHVDMEKVGRNDPWCVRDGKMVRKAHEDVDRRAAFMTVGPHGRPQPIKMGATVTSMIREYGSRDPQARYHSLSGILKGTTASSPSSPPSPVKQVSSASAAAATENENETVSEAEPSLVTNENRKQYVQDYIFWLTDKSVRPQYDAFARGFHACLDRTALSIFTPSALKSLVEGSQRVDLDVLEQHARYSDGYHEQHPTITDFWAVVKQWHPQKVSLLLEFVTASDRVPVTGTASIAFTIQRAGNSDERLPTSMTCFGRLLLPQYSSRAILEEKLDKALQNTKGFGAP